MITQEQLRAPNALTELGVAVVPNILTAQECKNLHDGLWKHAMYVLPELERTDPTTFREIFKLLPSRGMLQQHYGFGVCQAAFDVRQNPKVVAVFETIFGPGLTSSVDGVAFGLPPEYTNRGYHGDEWLHLDQNPKRSAFECVQGWVTALDVGEGDGTLRVLAKSHRYHGVLCDNFDIECNKDWYKLSAEQIRWYKEDKRCEQLDIQCNAGDMVLWDSRTVHSGRAPLRGRAHARERAVVYTSYLPRARLTEALAKKKRKCVLTGRMTTHWANKVRMFSVYPRTYGAPVHPCPPYHPPTLSAFGARLFGWTDSSCPLLGDRASTQ